MALDSTLHSEIIQLAQETPSSDNLYRLGKLVLDSQGESDGKLLFLMRASKEQWNSSITDPDSPPYYLGVYASPLRKECGLYPGKHTISLDSPKITIHEAKKFLHYLVHKRPTMVEMLYSTRDHYMSSTWLDLLQLKPKIVSLAIAAEFIKIGAGNITSVCYSKRKPSAKKVNNLFYVVTRVLSATECILTNQEIKLSFDGESDPMFQYLQDILGSKYNLEELIQTSNKKIAELEELLKENPAKIEQQVAFDMLNDWLLQKVRIASLKTD